MAQLVNLKAEKYSNTSNMTQPLNEIGIRSLNFKCIGLNDVGKAQFMRRIDSKYLIPVQRATEFLSSLKQHYYIVENNSLLMPEYFSEYFDTNDLSMYLAHHNKRPKRYKVRVRHYMASGDAFLEVKARTPSGETLKKRIEIHNNTLNSPAVDTFIKKTVPYRLDELTKTLETIFNRITLVSFDFNERVTMDFNILLKNSSQTINLSSICVIESKRDKYHSSSHLINLLKHSGFRQNSFSKYSIGCALIYNVKANNFKPLIHQLNQYKNESALVDASS
ncbi:MAG: polyphosphate polymerase domain-containing protein [Bacteroidota bacterium]